MISLENSPDPRIAEAPFASAQPTPAEPLQVLLVEDDTVDRMAVRRYLAEQGSAYVLTEADSIHEAKATLSAGYFDVMLVDYHLPDGSGFELFANAGETPIVFVTGANDLTLAVQAVRRGAADYLVKDTARSYLKVLTLTLSRAVRESRTRRSLRQSQQLFHQVFDDAPMGKILASPDGRILRVNRAAYVLLGYDQAEFVTHGFGLILQASDFADCKAGMESLLSGTPRSFQLEKNCRHKSGRKLQVIFNVSLIRNSPGDPLICVIQLQDMTESRRMEDALRTSEAQLRQLLDSLPAAVFASDATGLITYFNPQTEALWGRPPRLGDPADRFCSAFKISDAEGTLVPPEYCWMAVALAERRVIRDHEMVIEFAANRQRNVLAYSNPMIDASGRLTGAINILVDATELKRLEHHERLLEAQLNHTRKLEAIGTLAGGVAHEFNNLLTGIMGNLQLAGLDTPSGSPARPYLLEATGSSRRARDLVSRMLTFSRQAEGIRNPIRLETVITDAEQLLLRTLPPEVNIRIRTDGSCPPIRGNIYELNEVIVQLGRNASQAMGAHGGLIEMTLTHATPAPELRERYPQIKPHHSVCLSVRDTGMGMSAATQERIFEPFFTTKQPGQGTGLGLAGVYGVMKRHRGAIVVESSLGAGTTVQLFFPEADAVGSQPPMSVRPA